MDLADRRMVVFGCGYLGRYVAREAARRGMEVTGLTRNEADAAQVTEMGIGKTVVADLHERAWHREVAPGPDVAVISVSSGGRGVDGWRESWVEGVQSVLDWARVSGKIGTLIFTSSTSVYAQNEEQWVTESDPATGGSEAGRVLREAEALLERESASVGRSFILRLGGIYGPGRHHLLDRARDGGLSTGEGDAVFLNSIHVDDAAGAVIAAAGASETIRGGIFNIVDDLPVRKGEILRYLAERVETGAATKPETPPTPEKRRRSGPRPSRQISNRKAREVLGWRPLFSDFRAGYAELLREQR